MPSNLANIYSTLMKNYGQSYTITYSYPPSYILRIVGDLEGSPDSKTILVYAEDRTKIKYFTKDVTPPKKLKPNESFPDLNLTGSPLKDNCLVDAIADLSIDLKIENFNPWKLEEECHKGILIEKARSIMSDEIIQKSATAESKGSIWFLCDGSDVEKTLLLQYEVKPGYFSRGCITFKGIVPVASVCSEAILQCHFQMAKPGSDIETFVENTYKIKPEVSLRCSWSSVASIPSLIDLSICDVVLNQKFQIDNCAFVTQDFINQLRILLYIRDEIIAYNSKDASNNRSEPNYRCGSGIEVEELRKNVNEVMTEISGFAEMDSPGLENDFEEVITRAKVRRLVDVTDKLWEILKACSSYKDLKMAFNIVFQCAARCNVVNTPSNKNRLAEIITEVANRRLAIPCLSGTEPLELLLEIGLEKLYKDYEYILSESKICSGNLLKTLCRIEDSVESDNPLPNVRKSLQNATRKPEVSSGRKSMLHTNMQKNNDYQTEDTIMFKNSNFDQRETALRLARLYQIHCTIEHILMIHINLNLPKVYADVCKELLRKPLPSIETIADNSVNEMEISLSAHHVRDILEGRDPYMRRITLKSMNKFREMTTTFFYSIDNVFPPLISENLGTEENEFVKENTYFCWLYRKIVSVA